MKNIRYYFEHQLLPQLFYEDKGRFIGKLIEEPEVIFQILDVIYTKYEEENPYSEDAYAISFHQISDEAMAIELDYPEPELEPLCYRCYMIFDMNLKKTRFFTIERASDTLDEPFVCSWDEKGGHYTHGGCNLDDVLESCLEVYGKLNACEMQCIN